MNRIDWWTVVVGQREKERLSAVVDSGFINDGAETDKLAQMVAAICEVPFGLGTTSGTTAIFLALAAAGVGHGDEVLVPDITFIATANAVTLAGATPVFVDVDARTLGMDPRAAAVAVTPRTKAMIPVHVSGRAADLPALLELARVRGLIVVEDAAEALGSRQFGAPLGGQGDFGCFSFSANKTITCGQGGVVVCKDGRHAARLRELKDQGRPVRGTGGNDEHVAIGYNFKLTNLQATVALAQLESLEARLEHQRRLYRLYSAGLAGHPRIDVLPFDLSAGEVPQWVDALVDRRDELHDRLATQGIGTRKFWFPLHTQAPYRAADTKYPRAMAASAAALWLPSALTLTDADVARTIEICWEWVGRAEREERCP